MRLGYIVEDGRCVTRQPQASFHFFSPRFFLLTRLLVTSTGTDATVVRACVDGFLFDVGFQLQSQ